jgi:hypothetical protein|tara:strand:- start:1016 stop:1297 length:282 start_codon:yes stop_codon:yes gene_type:complete
VPLSNEEKARYQIVIDKEKSDLHKNKEFKTQRSLTFLSGIIGISLSLISLLGGAIFIGAALFFGVRWHYMEKKYLESQEKVERYQYFVNVESE